MDITSLLTEKCTSLLIFEIAGIEYCLSNTIISSISKQTNIIQPEIPETSKYSFLKVDDKSIPLIDLQKILTGKKLEPDEKSRIVIIEFESIRLGLLVGGIKEIFAIDSDYMTTLMKFNPSFKRYVIGTIEFENRKLAFLNIEKIVSDIGCI